jgi:hypothetical protein
MILTEDKIKELKCDSVENQARFLLKHMLHDGINDSTRKKVASNFREIIVLLQKANELAGVSGRNDDDEFIENRVEIFKLLWSNK